MRSLINIFVCILLIKSAAAKDSNIKLESLLEFKNVTITKVEPDGIRIMHDSGVTRIPIEDIPEDIRQRLDMDSEQAEAHRKAQREKAEDAMLRNGMVLTSTIIKEVNGNYRYFFDFRNHSNNSWSGSVEVTLHNKIKGVTNGKNVFSSTKPLEPNTGTFFFMDAHTGPTSVHGDASVVSFSYVVINQDGKRSNPVTSEITSKTSGF